MNNNKNNNNNNNNNNKHKKHNNYSCKPKVLVKISLENLRSFHKWLLCLYKDNVYF